MTKVASVLMLLVFAAQLAACAIPDPNDANYQIVRGAVAQLTPEQIEYTTREELWFKFDAWYQKALDEYLNRRGDLAPKGTGAYGRVREQEEPVFKDKTFLDLECKDDEHSMIINVTLNEFYECVSATSFGSRLGTRPDLGPLMWHHKFDECVSAFLSDAYRTTESIPDWNADDTKCEPKINKEFIDVLDENLNEKYTTDDLTRKLVSARAVPAWAKYLGIVVTGGVVVFKIVALGVALCALGADWGCPSGPTGPHPTSPDPGGFGGDK